MTDTLLKIESDYTARIYSHFTEEELDQYHKLTSKMQQVKEIEVDQILRQRTEKHTN